MTRKEFLLIKYALLGVFIILSTGCGGKNGSVDGTGTIEAREVQVASLLTSTVDNILVQEGDRVKKDAHLIELDHRILDLRLQQASSREKQARLQLALLLEGARSEDIQQAESQLEQAENNLGLAEKEWQRVRSLFAEGSITKREYDTVQNQFETSTSRYEGARAALNKIKDLARPQEIESAQAAVELAAAETAIIQQQIDDSTIDAPMDGTVSEIFYEEGEIIQVGRPLLTVRDMDEVYITVYLSGPMLSGIRIGGEADIYIDGVPDRPFRGVISYISDEAEFTPKNVQTREQRVKLVYGVKLDIPNEEGVLKPGMPADIILRENDNE